MTPLETLAVELAVAERDAIALDFLARTYRDLKTLSPDLFRMLSLTSADAALEYAETLRPLIAALREIETLALQRAARLGTKPLPFMENR